MILYNFNHVFYTIEFEIYRFNTKRKINNNVDYLYLKKKNLDSLKENIF